MTMCSTILFGVIHALHPTQLVSQSPTCAAPPLTNQRRTPGTLPVIAQLQVWMSP